MSFENESRFGLNARFAEAFAALLWNMWLGRRSCIRPVWIKSLLTEKVMLMNTYHAHRFWEDYSFFVDWFVQDNVFHGVGQQDAHEALMAVVDALHEDMARVYRVSVLTLEHENVTTYSLDPRPSFSVWSAGDSSRSHQFTRIKGE